MEVVKVATPTPQVEMGRNAAISRVARAQAVASDGGGSTAENQVELMPGQRVDPQELRKTAEELAVHYDLKMEVAWDDQAGCEVLKVLTPDGKRLLRQYPAEAVLKMAERLRSGSAEGLLTSLV